MNFINRAFKNITRRVSRTILLAITFFVIGNFVIVGLGVSQASESAKILTRQKMRAVVTYSVDYDAAYQYADSIEDEDERNKFYEKFPRVKLIDVNPLLKDERVKTANALSTNMFYHIEDSGVDFVHLNNQAEENMGNNGQSCEIDSEGNQSCYVYKEPTLLAKGNFFPDMIEFNDGDYTLIEGRFYTQEEIDEAKNVCLITSAFSQLNNLNIGDEFSIQTHSENDVNNFTKQGIKDLTIDDVTFTLEVIGIYENKYKIAPGMDNFDYTMPYENPDNMLLIPSTTAFSANLVYNQKTFDYYANLWPDDEYYQNPDNRPSLENITNNYVSDVTILLNDPLEVDGFVEDYSNSLSNFMKLDANNEEFNKLSKPLDTLNLYSNFIVWLVVINAIIIISLVTALTLKTREYEIGVLLSIGASKLKVVSQFFIELALVAILGFTLSIVSGSLIANKVGAVMLEYQIQESDVDENQNSNNQRFYSVWDNNYTTEISLDDLISEYNVTVSPIIIAEIYVLGLGIVFVSVIIPSIMIMRFNPKKILMNQN